MAQYDINWNAVWHGGGNVSIGTVCCPDGPGTGYLAATTANLAAVGRMAGVAISTSDSNGIFQMQYAGELASSITGLLPGAIAAVIVSPTGTLQRKVGQLLTTDYFVGDCDALGSLTLMAFSRVNPAAIGAANLAGDVTGPVGTNVVARINGATVPAAGALTVGNVLQVTGVAADGYGPVNLAGGANFVSGTLPTTRGGTGLATLGTAHQVLRTNQAVTANEWAAAVRNECTLEQFGADGTAAGNQTALSAVQAAMNGGTVKTLKLCAIYPIAGAGGVGITLPAGCSIIGDGDSTGFTTTANITVIQLTSATGASLRNFSITGNTTDGSGGDQTRTLQFGVACGTGAAVDGQFIAQFVNVNVDNCFRGFSFDNQAAGGAVLASQQVTNCRARYCTYNFYTTNHCEYISFTGCQAMGIGTLLSTVGRGLYIGSGNITWVGGTIQQCWRGIELQGGINAGHGVIADCNCNHNATNVYANGVTLGFQFIGGNFYEGNMQFIGCTQFITFIGGQLDPTSWIFDGSMVRFMEVELPMSYFSNCVDNANNNASTVQWFKCRANNGTDPPPFVAARVQPAYYFSSDANQTLTLQQSEAELLDIQPNIIAPATFTLTGSWRADFPGTQWNGSPSLGASGGRTLASTGGQVPTVGPAALNQAGNPAAFDGVTQDQFTALAATSFIALGAYTIDMVVTVTTAAVASSGTPYTDPNIFCDQGAVMGIAWATKGGITGFYHWNTSAGIKQTVCVAATAGVIHRVTALFDGANIQIIVDGNASALVPCGAAAAYGTLLRVMSNYNKSIHLAGYVYEINVANTALAAATLNTLGNYYQTTYGTYAVAGTAPAAISAPRTITIAKPPLPGVRIAARNRTLQTVTMGWNSGAGVSFTAGQAQSLYADGTNAFAGGSSSFVAGGDLTGTNISQQVVALTGSAGTLPVATTARNIQWASAATTPTLSQATTGGASGAVLNITAQAAATTGGSVQLTGGAGSSVGGFVQLSGGAGTNFGGDINLVPSSGATLNGAVNMYASNGAIIANFRAFTLSFTAGSSALINIGNVNSVNGSNLTITSQAGSSVGGDLQIGGGVGNSVANNGFVDFQQKTVATTASAFGGGAAIPATCGFVPIKVGGVAMKMVVVST